MDAPPAPERTPPAPAPAAAGSSSDGEALPAGEIRASDAARLAKKLRDNVGAVFLGQTDTVDLLVVSLLARGHALVEDVPGVGKTTLAKALARSIDGKFSRVQLTPDLLPADLLGVGIYNQNTGEFDFKPGPVFANIVVADEVNRTTPRTQSALLEAMAEGQVSAENATRPLPQPFMLIATQNPFEFEGTYVLPENQLDRFVVKIAVGYPSREVERRILVQRPGEGPLDRLEPVLSTRDVIAMQNATLRVRVDAAVLDYLLDLVARTRTDERFHLGVSPRGSLALLAVARARALIDGRDYTVPDDIKKMFLAACAHRVITRSFLHNGDAEAGRQVLQEILDATPTPG